MSRKTDQNEVVEPVLDENGDVVYSDVLNPETTEAIQEMISETEAKKEIQRLNKHFVNEFKSTIRTVIIALDRSVSFDEIKEAIEFFEDTSVDVKLVKRAIRALVKEEKLTETSKNNYELSAKKRTFYASLKALKENPTHR